MHYDFFITFGMMLLIASVFINGWYEATRGWETNLPDGTIRKDGRLLKGWYFFWNKKRDNDKFITLNDVSVYFFMRNAVGDKDYFGLLSDKKGWYLTNSPLLQQKLLQLQKEHGVEIYIGDSSSELGKFEFSIHKREPDYVYPEWVRDMLVDCIYCFASLYGSIVFWTIHILALGSDFYAYMYGWSNNKPAAIFFTWVAFVVSLAYVNGYLHKKIHK